MAGQQQSEKLSEFTSPQLKIMGLIRRRGECSRTEIRDYFGWGPAWCANQLKGLLERKVLIRSERKSLPSGGRGRCNQYLMMNPDAVCAFGVNIGFDRVSVGLVDIGGRIIERGESFFAKDENLDRVAMRIHAEIKRLARMHARRHMAGTGISFAGKVIAGEDGSLHRSPGAQPWRGEKIAQIFRRQIAGTVEVNNDKAAAMLAELRYGHALGCHNAVFLLMDEGISLGMLFNGRILGGQNQNSGEFGHICLIPDGPFCHCGARGCLESVASPWAIENQIETLKKNGITIKLPGESSTGGFDMEMLSLAALNQQPTALHILRDAGQHIGSLLAIVVNTLDPEKIILGGILSQQQKHPTLITHVREFMFERLSYGRLRPNVELSRLGMDIGIVGGAALAFERLIPACPVQLFLEQEDPLALDSMEHNSK